MRAAVFEAPGQPLVVTDVAAPAAGPGELLIAVRCCGICGSDLHLAEVHEPGGGMAVLPRGTIMGHEFCGEVVDSGSGVDPSLKPGARVTALPYIACGQCRLCVSGQGHRCATVQYIGLGQEAGAFAELVRVGARQSFLLPDGVDWQFGALVEPLAVALHGVHKARLAPGECVLIMGGGPIGLATALWCRHFGAADVVVSDLEPARLSLAEQLGATATIDATRVDVAGEYKRLAGQRPDVVFECVGVPGTQQLAFDYAPANGRIVVVGVCMAADTIVPVKAITKELQVNYVFMYRPEDFAITLDMLNRERIDPSAMLTREVGFDDFSKAFEALKADKSACKVLLRP